MSLRTRLAGWLIGEKGLSEAVSMIQMLNAGDGAAKRGTQELINAYKVSPWLRAAVSKIATHVSSVPWELYATTRGKDGKAFKSTKLQSAGYAARQALKKSYNSQGELKEIEDHPILDLLAKANPGMTGLAARKVTQTHISLKGESFWILETNNASKPIEYYPVPPNWVADIPSEGKPYFEVNMHRGQRKQVPTENMIWFRELDPSNPFGRGCGTGESLGDEIDTDEYAAKYIKTFFYNRGRPDLLVSLKNANEATLKNAQARFEQKFRGYANAHKAMWTSGDISIKELQQSFHEMELINLRTWERDAFINVFGIPPEILGILKNSNKATAHVARLIFAEEVLIPALEFIRSTLQMQLIPWFDDRLVLDYVSPSPDDKEYELQAMTASPWGATRGEWRMRMGLEDRGDIDNIHMVPFSLVSMKPEEQTSQLTTSLGETKPKALLPQKSGGIVDAIVMAVDAERLNDELDPIWNRRIEEWGQRELTDNGLDPNLFTMRNPFVQTHLNDFSTIKIKGLVNETTRTALRGELIEGVDQGEGIKDIAARVRGVFSDANTRRSLVIARTEVNGSANFSTYAAHKVSNVIEQRQWVATPDDRVREEHADLDPDIGNGQPVGINELFSIGSYAALYPGGFGVPELDINCRCTTIAVMGPIRDAYGLLKAWEEYDKKLQPWENETISGLIRGFKKQENDVIALVHQYLS